MIFLNIRIFERIFGKIFPGIFWKKYFGKVIFHCNFMACVAFRCYSRMFVHRLHFSICHLLPTCMWATFVGFSLALGSHPHQNLVTIWLTNILLTQMYWILSHLSPNQVGLTLRYLSLTRRRIQSTEF